MGNYEVYTSKAKFQYSFNIKPYGIRNNLGVRAFSQHKIKARKFCILYQNVIIPTIITTYLPTKLIVKLTEPTIMNLGYLEF